MSRFNKNNDKDVLIQSSSSTIVLPLYLFFFLPFLVFIFGVLSSFTYIRWFNILSKGVWYLFNVLCGVFSRFAFSLQELSARRPGHITHHTWHGNTPHGISSAQSHGSWRSRPRRPRLFPPLLVALLLLLLTLLLLLLLIALLLSDQASARRPVPAPAPATEASAITSAIATT